MGRATVTQEDLLLELHERRLRDGDVILAISSEVAAEEWRMGTTTMGVSALGFAVFALFLSTTGALPSAYFALAAIAGFLIAIFGAMRLKATLAAFKADMRAHVERWETAETERHAGPADDTGERP